MLTSLKSILLSLHHLFDTAILHNTLFRNTTSEMWSYPPLHPKSLKKCHKKLENWLTTKNFNGQMSCVMREPTICICKNKDADQLRGNREADQHLCFRYLDSTIPLLAKSKISSFWPSPIAVQPGLCQTWSESTLLVFLRLKYIL